MPFPYQCVKLNDGHEYPIHGLGTWNSKPGEVTQAVKDAIEAGYRHIDCALVYGNEPEVGAALKAKFEDGTIKREDIFITSKVWNTYHSKDLVGKCLEETLKNLGLSYVDLYLIHWPFGYKEGGDRLPKDDSGNILTSDVDYVETWLAMEDLQKKGLVKSIGVSNFSKEQLERILEKGSVVPANIQVECHPYLNQSRLFEFCKSKGITLTAYSPLGSPERPWATAEDVIIMDDPVVTSLAAKYGKTPAQILIRFQIQRGIVCIPKSVTKERIISNFKVFDFELSTEDMTSMLGLNCNTRLVALTWLKDHKHYPFNAEF